MQTRLHRLGSVPMLLSIARRTHMSVGLLLLFLYGYCLQPAEFAILVLLFLSTTLVETLATQGVTARLLAQLGGKRRAAAEQHTLVGTACIQNLVVAVGLFGALALLARPLSELLFHSVHPAPLLRLMALAGFLRSSQNLPRQLLQSRRDPRAFAVLRLGEALLTAALNFYVLAWAGLGLPGVLWAEVGREVLVGLLLVLTLRRDLSLRFSRKALRVLWRAGLPRVQGEIPALLLASNDRYVLAVSASLPHLGLYAFAGRIAQSLVDLAVQPLLNLLPGLRRDAVDAGSEPARVLGRFVTYFVALSGLLALCLAVFTEPLLRLCAPAFTTAAAVLPLLLLALLLAGVQRLLLSSLVLTGTSPRPWRLVQGAVAGASLVGNILLVPHLGMWGAAATAIMAQAVLCTAILLMGRRHGGLRFEAGRLAKVAAALCSTVYIARFVTPEPILGQIAAAAAMVFLYPALLGVFGFYTVAEIDRMREVLNRRVVLLPHRNPEVPGTGAVPAAKASTEAGLLRSSREPVASRSSR